MNRTVVMLKYRKELNNNIEGGDGQEGSGDDPSDLPGQRSRRKH